MAGLLLNGFPENTHKFKSEGEPTIMGWDRIRYFNGADGESTLLSADKASAEVVYGFKFGHFVNMLGHSARQVVDLSALQGSPRLQRLVNTRQAQVTEFPEAAKVDWYGRQLADHAVEIRPPVSDERMQVLNAFLVSVCEPNDAAYIIDNRGEHETVMAEF